MKRFMLITGICLLTAPTITLADDDARKGSLEKLADEARYENEYRKYQDDLKEFEEDHPDENQRAMMRHYFRDPQPPKR